MSVLQRKELEASPLADLHAIASELGVEGFRGMRKADLIGAILSGQGTGDSGQDDDPPVDVDTDDDSEQPEELEPDGPPEPPEVEEEAEPDPDPEPEEADREPIEEEPEDAPEPVSEEETATGVLDILPNGSGFVRMNEGQSPDDVYISPAQIRRCELRAGDEVSGPVRPPRRNERHPSLVRVETVNGADAEPPEQRPLFSELTPVFPREKLDAPKELKETPFGKGSRVAIAGPPGAGATTLLREIVATLAKKHPDVELQVVLAGTRPEEPAEWRADGHAPVAGGSFDSSPDAQTQAAELAVERAKRAAERGGHSALIVDSLELLPAGAQRRVFGAGRATEEAGSVTVIAAVGLAVEPLRWATTRVVLEPQAPSGTLRADLLG
ncbi:MAG TPA: Rho termination factor N-terminal domain-containing protein [Thermoleophilaceae bacterium]|jgi:transcription termination factor Rho